MVILQQGLRARFPHEMVGGTGKSTSDDFPMLCDIR